MSKSEIYQKAMLAVVNSLSMSGEDKLEVLEFLVHEKKMAILVDEFEQNPINMSKESING